MCVVRFLIKHLIFILLGEQHFVIISNKTEQQLYNELKNQQAAMHHQASHHGEGFDTKRTKLNEYSGN